MSALSFKCDSCGKEFAKIVISPDFYPKACPVCGATEIVEVGAAFNTEGVSIARYSCDCGGDCGHTHDSGHS
jgi:putative FmdB family regulatory protein